MIAGAAENRTRYLASGPGRTMRPFYQFHKYVSCIFYS
jgi:hypothetical protein